MSANPQDEMDADMHDSTMVSTPGRRIGLDEVMSNIGIGRFHLRILWMCGLGFSAVSIEVVLFAFLMPELRHHWRLDEYQLGLLASSGTVASIIGQLSWGAIADRYGRKVVFTSTVLFVACFGALSSLAQTPFGMVCLRSGVALGIGGNIAVDFSLYTEFLPTEDRGQMLLAMQAFWPVGQLTTCLVAWLVIPHYGWRVFLLVCMVPSLLTAFLRPFIPESPRWLLLHGRIEEATEVVRRMALENGHEPKDVGLTPGTLLDLPATTITPLAMPRPPSIGGALAKNASSTTPNTSLAGKLFSKHLRWTTLGVIVFSAALHAVSYGNMTFMPSMLERKKIGHADKYSFMVLTTLAEVPGVFCIMLFSHRLGRLLPMKVALLFIALAFIGFAAAAEPAAIVLCICMSAFFIEACWACFHCYIPEVYPTELRATATGFINSVGSLTSAMVPLSAAFVLDKFGLPRVCVFFATCAVLGSICAYLFLYVETHERDLEDVVLAKKDECEVDCGMSGC